MLQKPRKVSAGVLLSGTLSVNFLAFFPHYGTWYQASFSIEVISRVDTNSFQFKSFQYKFIQLRCSFMYLAYLKERKNNNHSKCFSYSRANYTCNEVPRLFVQFHSLSLY